MRAAPPPKLALAAYYAALFGSLGLYWPYFSLYLGERGLRPREITWVLSLGPVMGVIVPVGMGLYADAKQVRIWLLRGASVLSALTFALLLVVDGRLAIGLAFAGFAAVRSPLVTLVDAAAVEEIRERGGSYGALRLWGSAGFLLAVVAGGQIAEAVGSRGVLVATTAVLAVGALIAWAIPAPPAAERSDVLAAWSRLIGAPDLRLLLAAVLLAQTACAAYDGCFALHLAALGHGGGFIGLAFATGVLAEMGVLAVSAGLLARWGAERLLAAAIAVAALRWLLLAQVAAGAAILALQPLHGVTFGLFHAACVSLMRERGGAVTPTAAQGLYLTVAAAGSGLGMAAAGRLFERFGGAGLYTVAAVVAVAGLLFAIWFAVAAARRRA